MESGLRCYQTPPNYQQRPSPRPASLSCLVILRLDPSGPLVAAGPTIPCKSHAVGMTGESTCQAFARYGFPGRGRGMTKVLPVPFLPIHHLLSNFHFPPLREGERRPLKGRASPLPCAAPAPCKVRPQHLAVCCHRTLQCAAPAPCKVRPRSCVFRAPGRSP